MKSEALLDFGEPSTAAKEHREVASSLINKSKANALTKMLESKNVNIEKLLGQYKVTKVEELTEQQHLDIIRRLEG